MFDSMKESVANNKKQAQKSAPTQTVQTAPASQTKSVAASATTAPSAKLAANVLASVGTWTITVDEFNARLLEVKQVAPDVDINSMEIKSAILQELVRQQLIIADAEKKGLPKKADIINAVKEFQNTLLVQETVRELTKDIKVTDEDAKKFYDENKDKLVEPTEYHVREIVVGSQAKAAELFVEIMKGADFATIAKDNSIAKSAAQGGDLGFLNAPTFPEMGNVVLSLKVGDVSNPFNGPEGVYIIKLDETKGGKQIEFEKIKQDILQNETITRQDKIIMDYLNKLQQEFNVQINPDLLNDKK